MAKLGCLNLSTHPRARVLIGGLGMGYSVRAAQDILDDEARVVVADMILRIRPRAGDRGTLMAIRFRSKAVSKSLVR